ncbi:flavoprotein [Mangrovactinospora gilvigrisea]|uniref:flavoprotein n=1 Tax=Mangrovactinospora gilvigrisea TaxID=1428644 RepID=UPI0008FCC992
MTTPRTAPVLGIQRLLWIVSGSSTASGTPFWLSWFRTHLTDIDLQIVLTRSAMPFVARHDLQRQPGTRVVLDDWESDGHAKHVEFSEWAQAILIYPATFHYTARLALGLADTPSLLAAQCTSATIAVAPSLPPGGSQSSAYQQHQESLTARKNIVLVPPRPGASLTTGRQDAWVPPPLPEVLQQLESHRTWAARANLG